MDLKILYGLILILAISAVPVSAQQSLISVQTNDKNYEEKDIIVISGAVNIIVGETPVVLQIFFEGNRVEIAQLTVAQDGSYSHTVIAEGPRWQKSGDYRVSASYGEGNIVETEFKYSLKSDAISTKIFEVDAGSYGTFDVKHTVIGATIKDIRVNQEIFGLVVQIESTDEGSITLELPREFVGANTKDGKDEKFIILIDTIPVDYEEEGTSADIRTITIEFEQGDSDIEIIGTYVMPEFGAIVMVILIVGIMTTVLATRSKLQMNI